MATRIYDNQDINKSISKGDFHWYKVKFSCKGKANFYLNPEDNLDSDLYLCRTENEDDYLKRSIRTTGKDDVISEYSVIANKYYYIGIKGYKGSGEYLFRCKIYPNVYALVSTDSTRLTDEQQKSNAKYIYDYLSNEGWTKEAICGLLGNIQQESHLNHGVWQDLNNTNLGYGLVQWDDATKFLGWAELDADGTNEMAQNNPKQLMDLQLEFLIWSSLKTTPSSKREWFPTTNYDSPYKMFYEEYIVSTKDVGDLALVFHGSYERSADNATRRQNRIDYANMWYEHFNKFSE